MYNEQVKNEFIAEDNPNDTEIQANRLLFKKCEDLEEKVGQDLFDIENSIIAKYIIESSNVASFETVNIYYLRCLRYKKWALKKNYISEIGKYFVHEEVDIRKLYNEHTSNNLIKTPSELVEALRVLDIEREQVRSDAVCGGDLAKLISVLIYNGIEHNEALNIKVNEVIMSDTNAVIAMPNRIVELYSEFKDIVKHVRNNRLYYAINNNSVTYEMSKRLIDDGKDRDIKGMLHITTMAINRGMGRRKISLTNLFVMGRIYHYKTFVNPGGTSKEFVKWYELNYKSSPPKRRSLKAFFESWG